jgi:hypothetical protein
MIVRCRSGHGREKYKRLAPKALVRTNRVAQRLIRIQNTPQYDGRMNHPLIHDEMKRLNEIWCSLRGFFNRYIICAGDERALLGNTHRLDLLMQLILLLCGCKHEWKEGGGARVWRGWEKVVFVSLQSGKIRDLVGQIYRIKKITADVRSSARPPLIDAFVTILLLLLHYTNVWITQ